ncbi:phosphonate ABC transporter, permease protein PhnE [Rhodospira trueperi]|uniref:Phosphonate transport system permease protein n=1 Tax=Rhodospira trueperi TaxID=69960 RepID=A0A1G7H6D7_9PROT|nr:phosphonate ABC transporter, permease protein PhnE [Rhodospira trueperi]SDE96000.1 phosphonate transport system permease protein [Rhodospira trueperi]
MSTPTFDRDALLAAHPRAVTHVARGSLVALVSLVLVFTYLIYAVFAFDIPRLIATAEPQRAVLLVTDSVAHKVHVTKSLRRPEFEVAVEGERTATYTPDTYPAWVRADDDAETVDVDLGDGYVVHIVGDHVTLETPDDGTIDVQVIETGVTIGYSGEKPDWVREGMNVTTGHLVKFDARPTIDKRIQITRSKIEIHRYFTGWEHFFFPFNSPLHGLSAGEVAGLAVSEERLDPARSNAALIFETFWNNPEWQHGHIFKALLETVLMGVLGTFTAALVGLPLAFAAAHTFNRFGVIRFALRRLFDFLRGIDMLIWSLIFIRAFGLGPLTGALAIAFTDTGTLGKLFSEALENIDRKQIEGVSATGANRWQRYRYGVIPQILPVFVSQGLYYLESNMRSATVIGALGAGGIGLVLVETIRTSRDWENTLYIIILTILLVVAMDGLSSWLRRRLIRGG